MLLVTELLSRPSLGNFQSDQDFLVLEDDVEDIVIGDPMV